MARYRRTRGWPRLTGLAVVGLLALVAVASPAASFTLADHPRVAGSDVVTDVDGTLGLDVAASVTANRIERLVDVENRLGTAVTVTVTVTNTDRHDLYVDGTNHGTQATFTLADGAIQRVDVEAHASVGSVDFDVSASAVGLSVTATGRSASVTSGGGPPGSGGLPGGL